MINSSSTSPSTSALPSFLPSSPASPTVAPAQLEFDFLCRLACVQLSSGQVEWIANTNFAALDWTGILRMAELHGVLPLAARNLIEYAHGLPAEVEQSLRTAYEANIRRSLWFTAELVRIIDRFKSANLFAIPYKGPVLAHLAYHGIALRNFSDLDFLISSADFHLASQSLSELGYRPSTEFTPAIERFWLREGNERTFDGAAGKNLVELQWAILPRFNAIDLAVEDMMGRTGTTVLGGSEMPCLSPEDSLLALSVHAAKHLWTRLIWLVDIAESLRCGNIDYATVMSRARRLGIVRILALNFWLVKNVLGSELPEPFEKLLAADSRLPELGREFAGRIARGSTYNFETTEYFRLSLKLRERRWDRFRYLWGLLWTPGPADIASVHLPDALFPLYRVVRIARLIGRLIRLLVA